MGQVIQRMHRLRCWKSRECYSTSLAGSVNLSQGQKGDLQTLLYACRQMKRCTRQNAWANLDSERSGPTLRQSALNSSGIWGICGMSASTCPASRLSRAATTCESKIRCMFSAALLRLVSYFGPEPGALQSTRLSLCLGSFKATFGVSE